MSNVVYLVTGANRPDGIGFTAVKDLLKDPQNHIVAAVRDPDSAAELKALAAKADGRLAVVQMDVSSLDSVKASFETVAGLPFVRDHGLDAVWANAGISLNAFTTVTQLDAQDLLTSIQVNALGPVFLVQVFLPLLRLAKQKKIIYTSTALASAEWGAVLGDANAQFPTYGASKAAANHLFKRLHNELAPEGFIVACFHPGLVGTSFSGVEPGKKYGDSTAITVEEAGKKATELIVALKPEDSGKLLWSEHPGFVIPW